MMESVSIQQVILLALPFFPVLFAVFAKVSFLVALTFVGTGAMKDASANLRRAVWLSAIGSSLLILLLSLHGPLFPSVVRPAPFAAVSASLLSASGIFTPGSGMPSFADAVWHPTCAGNARINGLPAMVAFVWIAGALSGLLRMLVGKLRFLRFARAEETGSAIQYMGLVREISKKLGISREVRVFETLRCASPFTRGVMHPVIVLPTAMRAWSLSGKRSVLLHELRHVKCGDSFSLALAYSICSLLWYIPLVWAAYARLYQEQEKACDAAVIASGMKPHVYAMCILDAAQFCREPALLVGLRFSGRRKRFLKDRIQAILREGKKMKKRFVLFGITGLLLGAVVLALLLFTSMGYAENKYKEQAHEAIYGTWANPNMQRQKNVSFPGGSRDYVMVNDSAPLFESEAQLAGKWIDSDGNTWYKRFGTVVAGVYKGTKWQSLERIGKAGTVREWVIRIVADFGPGNYPTAIDSTDSEYCIYYRAAAL